MADMRKCIGSAKFGIEAHEAPVDDFPAQPSQKDGLGRMCKPHWNQYTSALRKAALARKADGEAPRRRRPSRPAAASPRRRRKRQEVGREARADPDAGPARAQGGRAGGWLPGRRRIAPPPAARPSGPGREPGALSRSVASMAVRSVIAARGPPVAPVGDPAVGRANRAVRPLSRYENICSMQDAPSADPRDQAIQRRAARCRDPRDDGRDRVPGELLRCRAVRLRRDPGGLRDRPRGAPRGGGPAGPRRRLRRTSDHGSVRLRSGRARRSRDRRTRMSAWTSSHPSRPTAPTGSGSSTADSGSRSSRAPRSDHGVNSAEGCPRRNSSGCFAAIQATCPGGSGPG